MGQSRRRPASLRPPNFSALPHGVRKKLMVNWNKVNNEYSEAVVAADCLEELLLALGCNVKGSRSKECFRGPCPVHGGVDDNFEVRADGHTFPIRWVCYSHNCHKRRELKNNLLGLVRGALTGDPDRPASLYKACQFLKDFLADRNIDRTHWVSRPTRRAPRQTFSWTRDQVRSRLTIPSPYFLSRGFHPSVLDRLDIGESHKLGRVVIPIYDDSGRRCIGYVSRSVHPDCGGVRPLPCARDVCVGRMPLEVPARLRQG